MPSHHGGQMIQRETQDVSAARQVMPREAGHLGCPRRHVGLTGHVCAFPTHSGTPQANVPSSVHAPHAPSLQPRSPHQELCRTPCPQRPRSSTRSFGFNHWALRKQTHRHGNYTAELARANLLVGKVG